jgi:hypothetical protein
VYTDLIPDALSRFTAPDVTRLTIDVNHNPDRVPDYFMESDINPFVNFVEQNDCRLTHLTIDRPYLKFDWDAISELLMLTADTFVDFRTFEGAHAGYSGFDTYMDIWWNKLPSLKTLILSLHQIKSSDEHMTSMILSWITKGGVDVLRIHVGGSPLLREIWPPKSFDIPRPEP